MRTKPEFGSKADSIGCMSLQPAVSRIVPYMKSGGKRRRTLREFLKISTEQRCMTVGNRTFGMKTAAMRCALRKLNFMEKQYGQVWAGDMADLLLEIRAEVETLKPDRDGSESEEIGEFERRHDEIISRGFADNPFTPPKKKKKKGRPKRPPPLNLLIRLRDYRSEPLAFMYDFQIPSDSNAAERDARKRFACIRGYISAARKNSKNIFEAIREAFLGNPFIPDVAA